MRTALGIHILAGGVAIASGFVALAAAKGRRLHRRSGMLFAYAMLTMATIGASLAIARDAAPAVNVPAALLTSYLVLTGLATVRPLPGWSRGVDVGLMLLVLGVSGADLVFGWQAIASGGRRHGIPAFPFVMFAIVGLLAVAGDARMLRAGSVRGRVRLARHLWRMSYALLVATMSFFLGQAKVFPKPVRIPGLLAMPVLAVLVAMLYWLWRVRRTRTSRIRNPIVTARSRETGTLPRPTPWSG